jgi:hypothetical protein
VAKRQWRELIEAEEAERPPLPVLVPPRPGRRRWPLALVAVAALVAWGGAAAAFSYLDERAWVRATTVGALREDGVVYRTDGQVFVVGAEHPVALSAVAPGGGGRLLYCRLSDTFIDASGDRFDMLGRYLMGPAPRGMERLAVRVRDGSVEINPRLRTDGPERFHPAAIQPTGPFCEAPGPESPPGFFKLPPPSGGVGIPPVPVA